MNSHQAIGSSLNQMGGYLKCNRCGRQRAVGDTAVHMANGWPKCCDKTMEWVTQRLIDESEAYGNDCNGRCEG